MKEQLVKFVDEHMALIARFQRVLTTGTTGGLLRMRYSSRNRTQVVEQDCRDLLGDERTDFILDKLRDLPKRPKASERLVNKIVQLPSGPKGGDILIANEVLTNHCQVIVFFHDPEEAHPHEPDIRLLERTCQLPGTYAVCVSDRNSAEAWANSLKSRVPQQRMVAQRLREKYGLAEVVIADIKDDKDGDEVGNTLARAAAGYLDRRLLLTLKTKGSVTVGISYGWASRKVFNALRDLRNEGLLSGHAGDPVEITWLPLIGVISVQWTEQEASQLARDFRELYGGVTLPFASAGFALSQEARQHEHSTIETLEQADIILTSAAPWDKTATLYNNTGLERRRFPAFDRAVGVISGVFLDEHGKEAKGEYHIVGLDYQGFRKAADRGAVILVCGGRKRRKVALAALRARLASVIVTTRQTAEWLAFA